MNLRNISFFVFLENSSLILPFEQTHNYQPHSCRYQIQQTFCQNFIEQKKKKN